MPDRYEISDSRRLELTPDEAHRLITTPGTWPEWQSEIESTRGPERLATGDTVEGDARMLGFRVQGHADMEHVDENEVVHQVIVGVKMQVRYDLEPQGAGVVVTHTLAAEMPRGLTGRLLSIFLKRRLRAMQKKLLDNMSEWRRTSGTVR